MNVLFRRVCREVNRKAELAKRVHQEREMAEVAECTFKPQTQVSVPVVLSIRPVLVSPACETDTGIAV